MYLEFKKYELQFNDGVPTLKSKEGEVIPSTSIGWVYNYGPPHDHNQKWEEVYLEDLHIPNMKKENRDVRVCVKSLCEIHERYCSCLEDRVPVLFKGKVIMDLYNLAPTTSVHTILLH